MSTDIHPPSELSEKPYDTNANCEMEISAEHENETDACLSENSVAVNAECEITGWPASVTQHEDVFYENSSKRNVTSQHNAAVAKETDGGWGWVIVCGVFCITALVGGIVFSFSLLYLEFVDMFDASRAVAGWIGSLHLFTSHILGNRSSSSLFVNFVFFCIDMIRSYCSLGIC